MAIESRNDRRVKRHERVRKNVYGTPETVSYTHLDVYKRQHQGPTMKRWRAGAQGRASIILKRMSHVGVTLKERN